MEEDSYWTRSRIDKLLQKAKSWSITADDKKDIERLYRDILTNRVPNELLDTAIYIFGPAGYFKAVPFVVSLLDHEDFLLRSTAVKVIAFHWQMKSHVDKIIEMLLNDPDEDVRTWAATGLGVSFRGNRNKKLLTILRGVVTNDTNSYVQISAYEAMLAIIGYKGREISLLMEGVEKPNQLDLSIFGL